MTHTLKITRVVIITLALLCMALVFANASVTLSPLFSDHMVLQRDKPVPVFGTAAPGESVTVTFNSQTKSTTADSLGNWQVTLSPMSVSTTAKTMTVTGTNTVTIADILIGDVWICGGQSNMAWTLGLSNRQVDVNSANFPGIRHFWVPLVTSAEPTKSLTGNWSVCSPSTAAGFSAVAFYFGRKIYQDQNANVPIGLISSTVGGTCIDPWLVPEGCTDIPELKPLYSQSILPWGPFSLSNGMIQPLAPYSAKGAIWYQGESGETTNQTPDSYFLKEKALIQGWKRLLQLDDFAFYMVQIANWSTLPTSATPETGGWPLTRDFQTAALAIPHTGMAVTIDIGETDDIHPKDKLDVGERLAFWALKNDYGRTSIVPSGPILKDVTVSGNKIICSFDYVGSGLMVGTKTPYLPTQEAPAGTALAKFSIAGASGSWYAATATIVGNTVEVSSPSVAAPTKVAYAYWQNPLGANLYNREGLPASPFCVTDVNAKYTITASAGTGGTISPVGTSSHLKRTTALYTITPDAGYYIQDVTVDGKSVGAVSAYTFDPIYANHTIAATFTSTAPSYTVTATANPGGTISPSGAVSVAQGASKAFTITPNPGTKATMTVDGAPMGQRTNFAFTDVRTNHTISATFSCTISAQSGYGGTITPNGDTVVAYGSSKTFNIAANPGFAISKVTVDGVNVGAVSSYTFNNVVTSHTITVAFTGTGGTGSVPKGDQLIFSCLTDSLPESGTIAKWPTYLPAGKNLTAMGNPTVVSLDGKKFVHNSYTDYDGFSFGSQTTPIACNGASVVVVAKPTRFGADSNWQSIVDVFYDRLVLGIMNGSGKICVRRNGSLELSNGIIPEGQTTILSLIVQPDGTYKVYANGTEAMSITGTSAMTSIVPGSLAYQQNINVGRNQPDGWTTFNGDIGDVFLYKTALTNAERIELETYIVNKLAGGGGATYTITASAGANGSISPSGPIGVPAGGSQTFTITPNPSYTIANVIVDGVSQGAINSYTFSDVNADHTISATFGGGPTSFTITSSAGPGGTITPSGAVTVAVGGSKSFAIAPNSGYVISNVSVDGVSQGAISSYTFTNVTANHTIAASFATEGGVPRTGDLLFSVSTDSFPADGATGNWTRTDPAGGSLSTMGSPTVETINGVKWAKNIYADGDGFQYGSEQTAPIPVNGASIVVAVKPLRNTLATPWCSIVDVFYGALVLAIHNDTGELAVWRNGNLNNTGVIIPEGQTTVLSLVVQPDGTYKLFANGTQVKAEATASAFTQMTPGTEAFKHYINVGRNWPDGWTTYNGNIGDVYFYKVALADAERVQLESILSAKFHASNVTYTINATAGPGGKITPSGSISVAAEADKTFAIAANVGYLIDDVVIDGVSQGAITTYTFNDVVTDHTIAATFKVLPAAAISGKVTDQATGAGIAGATVYFSPAANASANPAYTVTTNASGNYSQSIPAGTWYVCASDSTHVTSADQSVTMASSPIPGINFALAASGRNIPAMDKLLLSAVTDSLPTSGATGPWATFHPRGLTLTPIGTPTVETIGGKKWEQNLMGTGAQPWTNENDGFSFGTFASPIPVDGASIVLAAKPIRNGQNMPWIAAVDVFYDRLVLGVRGDTGMVCVRRNGSTDNSTIAIPDGQITILSLVVQPDGTYKVYANGTEVMNITTTSPMTSLVPAVAGTWANYIDIGRGGDWWSTFNGNIGDVFVYKTALTDAQRLQLEADLTAKFAQPVYQDATTMADLKAKADGALVRLTGSAVVTYAPRDASSARTTSFFYIAEKQGLGGLKVVDKASDNLTLGNQVTNLTGYVRKPAGKEMYLELTTDPTGTGSTPILPIGMNNKSALTDAKTLTNSIKVWGKVKNVTGTTSFTINDGYGTDVTVVVNGVTLPAPFDTTTTAVVTGVITRDDSGNLIVQAQDVKAL